MDGDAVDGVFGGQQVGGGGWGDKREMDGLLWGFG